MAGAPVGGRLEAAPPKPVTNPGDRWRLMLLLLVAGAVHALVVARTAMTARDSIGFARNALLLAEPSAHKVGGTVFDVLRDTPHPPGYPAALLGVATASDAIQPGQPLQDRMLFAGQLVSAVAGTLLVFPLYWLGRTLFGQVVGFAGSLLFCFLPVAARYTSDALTEGLYFLLLCTAVLLGTRAVRKPTVGGYLMCGLAGGVAYLVRPEGALAMAAVGFVAVALVIARREYAGSTLGRLTALTVGFLVVTVWYMLVIGGISNKNSINSILGPLNLRQQLQPGGAGVAAQAGPALFATWQIGDLAGAVKELAKEGSKSFHYLPPAFAVVGLLLAARRMRADPWLLVPVTFVGLLLPVLIALGLKEGYISERHTLAGVMVLCPFAAAGYQWLGTRLGRPWLSWVLLVVTIATMLPGVAKPLHRDRFGHKLVGEYLAAHADPADAIIDPFDWAGFYSGRTLKSIPPDPVMTPGRSRWAVIEPKEKGLSTLPRLQAAWNVMNDGKNPPKVVLQWPEGVHVADAKVVLYKQVVQ